MIFKVETNIRKYLKMFENNATAKLINSVKNEIGKTIKVIFKIIHKELRNKLQLQQWNNTTAVINWFKKIENKTNKKHYAL